MRNYKLFVLLIILGVLFFSPLRWFPDSAFDSSGDDHALQFFVPENYLSNFSIYSWSGYGGLSVAKPPNPTWHFMIFPFILKKIGFLPGQIIKIFYGLILSLSFIFTYLFAKELLYRSNIEKRAVFWGAVISGLMFVFSPLVGYTDWLSRLSATLFMLILFPALLYFFLLAINRQNTRYLIIGAVISSLLAFVIYVAVPWSFSFIIGIFLFLVTYFVLYPSQRKNVIKYSVVYLFYIFLFNLSWISLFLNLTFSTKHSFIVSPFVLGDILEQGASFIKTISAYFTPVYSFLMLPSKDFVNLGSVFKDLFYYNYVFIFLPLPFIISAGLLLAKREEKKILLTILIPAITLVYLVTVNITDIGTNFFSFLIKIIPGFIMFRNFYGKFPTVFSFFYALAVGLSVTILLSRVPRRLSKSLIISLMLVIIVVAGSPLLLGEIIGVSSSAGIHEKLCPEIPSSHFEAMNVIKADKKNSRVFIFPISFAQYMCFRGANNQCYVASPFIKVFTEHDEFGGIWSFTTLAYKPLPKIVSNLVNTYDFQNLYKILWLMDVKYVYMYEEIAPESAQMFLLNYSFIDHMKSELLKTLPEKIGDFGDIKLYKINYEVPSSHIITRSHILEVDNPGWVSELVYGKYLAPERKPLVCFKDKEY